MRWLAATESCRQSQLGKDILAFSAIRNASLGLQQERLEQEGASDSEQLGAAKARISALEKQIEDEKASLEYFATEHANAEERAEVAEQQARASAFYIQQLRTQIEAADKATEEAVEPPETWPDLVSWCDTHLAGRVVLTPRARQTMKSPEFEDLKMATRCLIWLANDGRNRRLNGGEGSLREEVVEDGIRNAHCGNDQFDLDWQGQRHTADWHIKNGGNTRDPKRCLRIYYFWHPDSQQIVVAEMPGHRRTGAT